MSNKIISKFARQFFDNNFASNKFKYIWQSVLAAVVCFFVLFTLSFISSAVVIASIASTAFIIFSGPHTQRSSAKYVLGGYVIGFVVGYIFFHLMLWGNYTFPAHQGHFDELFGAMAIGVSIFLMVVLDAAHPPASSASLALVITPWNAWTIVVTFFSLTLMLIARHYLRERLIDLI